MSEPNQPACEIRKNVAYANHDGVALHGDLYLPAGQGPFPLLINVHGGYWRRGTRDTFQHWGPYLAARGYAGFTVSYRLTKPGNKMYPEAVHDVRAAVQFMRARASEFRLDPNRIALWGNSAGAQLAAMVALAGDSGQFAGGYPQDPHAGVSTKVKVLIGVYGIYDLLAQWQTSQIINPGDNLVESFLGCSPATDRRRYFDASPISHAIIANNKTAVYLSWGNEDDVVDCTQSKDFLLALKQANFTVRTCVVPGAGHYWLSDPIEEPRSYPGFLASRLLRFLGEQL